MSNPRPIHKLHRELNNEANEAEPSFSYEQQSFLMGREEDAEDEFHRDFEPRSNSTVVRRDAGGSFWRTTATNSSGDLAAPSFSSMSMNQRQDAPDVADAATASESLEGRPRDMAGVLSQPDALREPPDATGSSVVANKKAKESDKATKDSRRLSKQRSVERRRKLDAQNSDIDRGHIETSTGITHFLIPPTEGSISRSSSDHSATLLYGKTLYPPRNGALLAKSSSLIFPTGVELSVDEESQMKSTRATEIHLRIDACETVRWPKKKKLILENMQLVTADIPVKCFEGTPLGNALHKLSVAKNRLFTIPSALVNCLPTLKSLDLSQCDLVALPETWNMPQLRILNLSHNKLTDFPEEPMLEGLPDLQELIMNGNQVAEIVVPRNLKLLSKLEVLNLAYNELRFLPNELDQIKSLRTLTLNNNYIEKVPMRVCEMDIRTIDVSGNPVIQPPIETCERGICSMKRYYHCLRAEAQNKHKALEEVQKKLIKNKKREVKKGFPKMSRFFGSKLNYGSKDFGDDVSLSAIGRSVEEPIVLPSKAEKKILGRTRSASFDEVKIAKELDIYPNENPTKEATDSHIDLAASDREMADREDAVVNDTLKVVFVGMAMTGKTSMIKRLIEGRDAVIPKRDERTIGVDIYEWDPRNNCDRPQEDTRIEVEDEEFAGEVDVKLSVWDFAGQHVYHATHELFFSPHALYVVVWDMGATNQATHRRKLTDRDRGAFRLDYESSDEDDDDFTLEEESRRADRALERDIDEKVQFWVECIQSCAPGAAIVPVASFDDYFSDATDEASRRCNILKSRLMKHEERRVAGLNERLEQYSKENNASDEAAHRLRKLLCPYTRPKLVFGKKESVVRVSGTEYTGFDSLTQRIVQLATGKERAGFTYPLFRGHVGARIPRMRLEVRDAVREIRLKFKVVEWGYFMAELRKRGLSNVEDISDALHFLTNTGELSYFGSVLDDPVKKDHVRNKDCEHPGVLHVEDTFASEGDENVLDDFEQSAILSMDQTSLTAPSTNENSSISSFDEFGSGALSQYIFLNPRWLVAAVACILRHDLDSEIRETRRSLSNDSRAIYRFYEGNLNCPVITADDALMLWQAKKFTKKAAERAEEYSNNMSVTPFVFLQQLLVRFGVFVPIDLSIEKAFLGGKEYGRAVGHSGDSSIIDFDANSERTHESRFFFLPSLLGPGEPAEAWTYKNSDSWKTTLCHSILFPDGVPPGFMERITASVLSTIYAVSKGYELRIHSPFHGNGIKATDGPLRVKEILCWRTAFFLKLGTEVKAENGDLKESVVEIFAYLVDRESHLCVGSNAMGAGMRRLVLSAKGQVGDGGHKIWNGGYLLVIKSVLKIMPEYGGLEYEKQGFCPDCISKKAVSDASSWEWTVIRDSARKGESSMRCHHGHRVDTRLITGPIDTFGQQNTEFGSPSTFIDSNPAVPINDLLRGIVLVGLWDGRSRKVVRVGSGFIVDKKRGLIVTASHTLMNIWGDKSSPFGVNYYGLREGKVVIGVIPRQKESESSGNEAVFRYFARIVNKDPSIDESGECHLDACVLRITTRMEHDIAGNGDGCGDQPETLLEHNHEAIKRERLQHLKVTEKCELDETVRILGFNQGGEGLVGPGERLNRYVDFARGYVSKKFATGLEGNEFLRHRFKPREEVVVICPTIGGHSGGPCVNQQGEVIGILSRADPSDKQRCYLVPAYEFSDLVKQAKLSS